MENIIKIKKKPFKVYGIDVLEIIPLPKGEKGKFKDGLYEFNHIKFNGELVIDYDKVNKIIAG